jgi:hypothetical protein
LRRAPRNAIFVAAPISTPNAISSEPNSMTAEYPPHEGRTQRSDASGE